MKKIILFALIILSNVLYAQDNYYKTGKMYYDGNGVEKNYDSARYYFQKAFDVYQNPDGLAGLAGLYKNGFGVSKNIDMAFALYKQAADLGNRFSMKKIAFMYRDGIGTSKDKDKCFYWFLKLADYGDAESQRIVGYMYQNGLGTSIDDNKAVYYTEKASLQEDAIAITNLGYYYEYGFGRLKKNYNYAYSLYSYACKKECKLGCENLKKFNAWLIEMNLTAREIPLNEIIE